MYGLMNRLKRFRVLKFILKGFVTSSSTSIVDYTNYRLGTNKSANCVCPFVKTSFSLIRFLDCVYICQIQVDKRVRLPSVVYRRSSSDGSHYLTTQQVCQNKPSTIWLFGLVLANYHIEYML